jgi:hypothetical protein
MHDNGSRCVFLRGSMVDKAFYTGFSTRSVGHDVLNDSAETGEKMI